MVLRVECGLWSETRKFEHKGENHNVEIYKEEETRNEDKGQD